MNQYPHLNDTYVSDRLKLSLFSIDKHPITTITAPAGSGKTTAVKWWDSYRRHYFKDSLCYWVTAAGNDTSMFWNSFCRCVGKDVPELAERMTKMGCPSESTIQVLLELWQDSELKDKDVYLVFDNVQYLPVDNVSSILMYLADNISERTHIVLISRNSVFKKSQVLRMGRKLLQIEKDVLALNRSEIAAYAKSCGISISESDTKQLETFSGGWIALVYLVFCLYAKTGRWETDELDISKLIDEIMFEPLSPRLQKFLVVCSAAGEFTEEQACFLWGEPDACELLEKLADENAFLNCGQDGVYRFYNPLLENIQKRFEKLPEDEQRQVFIRLGDWHFEKREYVQAMSAYYKAMEWQRLLDVVAKDRGSAFNGSHADFVRECYKNCPKEILRSRPEAILTFALTCFTDGDIENMLSLNQLLMEITGDESEFSQKERNNYRGESQILLGFLAFNSISQMSEYHRRACEIMDRSSLLVNSASPWTFGVPSVLMLYHRDIGKLDRENDDMAECMPYYYKVTNGHGSGAEYAMKAESEFMRGNFDDAEIAYYKGISLAGKKNQYSIVVALEFTAMRLNLLKGDYIKAEKRILKLKNDISKAEEFVNLSALDMCKAWIYSTLGRFELVPKWIWEESSELLVMNVVLPALMVVQDKILLECGKWTRLVAHGEETKKVCMENQMIFCLLYTKIHIAAALEKLDKHITALEELEGALEIAIPDGLIMPFAEAGEYISQLLEEISTKGKYKKEIEQILNMSDEIKSSKEKILSEYFAESVDYGLSKREEEVAVLAAKRRTTKEIADTLNLTEHTVKNHLNRVFNKLGIPGTERNKRALLESKLKSKQK